ncbi:hypothetical protein HZA26_02740 [Candidatus Nomurabacteria bacterium]|nr:hypothetical protein [Candidatus Nomurabacteria bacterium]
MKNIILSISSIVFAVAVLAGGTGAFLKDSESSTGNTFASGVIDLKIDNESYVTDNNGKLVFSPLTSWALSNLEGKLFFNFLDLKPGDIGEDTISLHVNNNNAWACMNVKITSTPENGQPEPEALVDETIGENEGELQDHLYFAFWADDGDNVYEKYEKIWKEGLSKEIFNGENWTLADSQLNIWGGDDPLIGNTTKYIGKAWCFGELTKTPVKQDGQGKTGNNGPLVRGTGFSCAGQEVGNIVQSDGIKADVSFSVVQSRSNNEFLCRVEEECTGGPGDCGGEEEEEEAQYCSPGYWKQGQHFDSWAGYSPNQQFSSVFENAFPGKTLVQVLSQGGGGLNKLGRSTVGALMNAGSVDFPYTQAAVINMFNSVYPGSASAYEEVISKFELAENCPLN